MRLLHTQSLLGAAVFRAAALLQQRPAHWNGQHQQQNE